MSARPHAVNHGHGALRARSLPAFVIILAAPLKTTSMPFYEYECQACKFYMEVMQKITDTPLTRCPSCGKRSLKKLVSAPVFRLKGGGWYETDFKSDKENKRNLVGAEKERSEEHTSDLQSQSNLVCRLLLEKKKNNDTGSVE